MHILAWVAGVHITVPPVSDSGDRPSAAVTGPLPTPMTADQSPALRTSRGRSHLTVPREGMVRLWRFIPMIAAVNALPLPSDLDTLHANFLSILPRIETHAQI